MSLSYAEMTCPNCGAKTKESCNTWMYGSPVKTCASCNTEYIDRRWREVAIDGFDPRSSNSGFYLKGLLGFVVFTVVCVLLLFLMSASSGHFPLKLLIAAIGGILGSVFCAYRLFVIKSGIQDKDNAVFMTESKQRLKNSEYVEKLEKYGYKIPDEFKK